MSKRHPESEILAGFVSGELATDRNLKVAWHLSHCASCRRTVGELPAGRSVLEQLLGTAQAPPPPSPSAFDHSYEALIRRSYQLMLRRESELRRDRVRAPQLLAQLLRHPASRQRVLIVNTSRFRNWGLAELLLEHSAEAWFQHPERSETFADLALTVSACLPEEDYGRPVLADLMARCMIHIANARRIGSDHQGAEDAFAEADRLLNGGTGDPLERARFLYFQAVLRRDQRRFETASSLLRRAIKAYRRAGDLHEAGKTLVTLANLAKNRGEPHRAIEILQEALGLIEVEREPRLALITRHNLISYLADAERFMEARALLARSRALYASHADALTRLRHLWVQGQVAYGLAQLPQAERLLRRAREGFVAAKMSYDAALVSLDLALVYAREHRLRELRQLTAEVLPIFRSLEVRREAAATLVLFQQAALADALTTALVRQLATEVRAEQGAVEMLPESPPVLSLP